MAPAKKPSGWLQRNAARVRIWIEEGVLENEEADRMSQGVFDRMTEHQRTANTSRRIVTPYDEQALLKFMTAAAEFLASRERTPEVGQPGSDPPAQPGVEAREEQAPDELRMILRDEVQALMEANEHRDRRSPEWPSSPPTAQQQLVRLSSSPDLPAAPPIPSEEEEYEDWADEVQKASDMITSGYEAARTRGEEDDSELYSRPVRPVFCAPPDTQTRAGPPDTQTRADDVVDAERFGSPARPIFCPPPTSPVSSPLRPKYDDTPEPEPVDNGFRDYGVDHDIELYDLPRAPAFRPPPTSAGDDCRMDLDSREPSLGHASSPTRDARLVGETASPMEVCGVKSPISDLDVPMEDSFRGKPTSGSIRTIYPAPESPQQITLPPPQQKLLPPPPYPPSHNPFSFQTPGFQQFFTPRDFGTRSESSSPPGHGLFYRPPPSPSPLSRFPRVTQAKDIDSLSFVYRTIYAIEPEQEHLVFSPVKTLFEVDGPAGKRKAHTSKQEKLAFSPVKTIFEMSEFIKDEDASEAPDQMTQLLLDWMKRSEARQAAAEQKERERDETLQRIRDEQKRQADRLADLARQKTVSHAEAEKKKAELDRVREDELNEMMARHRLFYEEAGLEVPETLLVATSGRPDHQRNTDKEPKAEYVKPSLVGYLDPMAPHTRWDGQITDGTNSYVSYAGWLDHLQQVLEQKPTHQWKMAVLDTATLSCLRGRALAWYNSMTGEQKRQLRTDTELRYWQEWGRPLCRNTVVARAEARDRKRRPGETLTEYSWTKLAMLNEAYGSQRPAADIIRDIKDGLTPSDQEKIRTDLESKPSVARLLAEMERMDTIRGSTFQSSSTPYKDRERSNWSYQNQGNRRNYDNQRYNNQTYNNQGYGNRNYNNQNYNKRREKEPFDLKRLAWRTDKDDPKAGKQWSYEFSDGRIMYLNRACYMCGSKHFFFECEKFQNAGKNRGDSRGDNRGDNRGGPARAAFYKPQHDTPWDEFTGEDADEDDDEDEDDVDHPVTHEAARIYRITHPSWHDEGRTQEAVGYSFADWQRPKETSWNNEEANKQKIN
jgi:hypothetical protein